MQKYAAFERALAMNETIYGRNNLFLLTYLFVWGWAVGTQHTQKTATKTFVFVFMASVKWRDDTVDLHQSTFAIEQFL